jgi:hypothetical protein
MELRDNTGENFVTLEPLGYQFPDLPETADRWDRNWLNIRGHVTCIEGSWNFTDACMLTYDVSILSAWLRSAAARKEPVGEPVPENPAHFTPELGFIEPNVSFNLERYDKASAVIGVVLGHESAPPWLDPTMDFEKRIEGYRVPLTVELRALQLAAKSWDSACARFPKREGM